MQKVWKLWWGFDSLQQRGSTPNAPRRVQERRIEVIEEDTKCKLIHEKITHNRPEYEMDDVHVDQKPELYILTPVMVNPNSYESVKTVLISVGKEVGIAKYGSGNREFVFVYCDGIPY